MRPPKQERLDRRLEDLKRKKEIYDKRQEIAEIRRSMVPVKKTTSTKKFVRYVLINGSIVEAYSMFLMVFLHDSSALYALIGAGFTEAATLAGYFAKSYHETKQEEIIKLERDKLDLGICAPDPCEVPEDSADSQEADG